MIKKITKQLKPAAGVIAGSIAADVVVNKALPASVPGMVKSAAPIILGLILMGQKGEFIKMMGAGMVANAGAQLAKSTIPGLSGICEADMDGVFEEIAEEFDTLNDGEFDTLNGSDSENYA